MRPPVAALTDAAFERELLHAMPALRRNAVSLTGGRVTRGIGPDDLLQATLLTAWKHRAMWRPGQGHAVKNWCMRIMSNLFLTQRRRDRFDGGSLDALAFEGIDRAAEGGQEAALHYRDALAAMARLPTTQAEAMAGVALGQSYDDVAATQGVMIGTVKSRVARGRAALAEMLA